MLGILQILGISTILNLMAKVAKTLEDLFVGGIDRLYKKGQVILHQGDELQHVYYVKSGFVKVYNITDEGDERILIILGPKTSFPLRRDFDSPGYAVKYYYETMTDAKLCRLDKTRFAKAFNTDFHNTQILLQYITRTNADLVSRLEILESKNAQNKVVQLLPYLIRTAGKKLTTNSYLLSLKITHQDIANMVGLTRETTSIEMKKLQDQGVIQTQRGRLKVDARKLAKFTDVDFLSQGGIGF
jgi:CRP-like cAMP-binding protein